MASSAAEGHPPPYESEGQSSDQNWPIIKSVARKPIPTRINSNTKVQDLPPAVPVHISLPQNEVSHEPSSALIESMGEVHLNDVPLTPQHEPELQPVQLPSPAYAPAPKSSKTRDVHRQPSFSNIPAEQAPEMQPQLQYHHQPYNPSSPLAHTTARSSISDTPPSSNSGEPPNPPHHLLPPFGGAGSSRTSLARPTSAYSSLSDVSQNRNSPNHLRAVSANSGRTPDGRPLSYANLLNVPYLQPGVDASKFKNQHLKVGANAALLSHKKTLEMYRLNAKKTNDPEVQYQLALFMVSSARDSQAEGPQMDGGANTSANDELIKEARDILRNLADRGYPFAQYYLADGYASGMFTSKNKEDWDRAFPLFVSAGKHGHAESSYRAALCLEYGWGCRKDPAKAEQFYRHASSRNHPGAMTRLGKACLLGDFGLENKHREGLKWLRRAADEADPQYNSAPYELGLLHEKGYYDYIFPDEGYTAQLYTQAADLGHAEAAYRMGDSYEHGKLTCPKDAGLSIHFYTEAAQKGHAPAQLALCAWYLIGAEPILQKDENEAYEWALKAAASGFPKAEYAIGFFTETGIGCRPDTLEANVWYVRAAEKGDERAMDRLKTINAAAAGEKMPGADGSKSRIRRGIAAKPNETLIKKEQQEVGGKNGEKCVIM